MKSLIAAFAFIFIANSVHADYESTPLPQLINKSDCIVLGRIKQVDKESFVVKIISILKGQLTDTLITIKKFQDWTCAQRFFPYSEGQMEVLFLKKPPGKEFSIIGAGDEGEIFVFGDKIYIQHLFMAKNKWQEFIIYDKKIWGYQFDLTSFKLAIEYYLNNKKTIMESAGKDKNYNLSHLNNPVIDCIISELRCGVD